MQRVVLAFRGAGGEPPRASPCGVSPVQLQSTDEKFDDHKGKVEIAYATALSFVAVTDFIS
ncbi:hypothetical protein [Rossellomorea sp. YZS02]|uniref:hypothetical protein n=1 Tax=Rossellomorea sp. YZS02 TaxID=3097358 RepID=UPI002A110EA0|nr:hypothetical protein [Rossellomorea sp. YZS02]MDX8343637.1 hypothetical protein [Rossellomorea sp. YZS02]